MPRIATIASTINATSGALSDVFGDVTLPFESVSCEVPGVCVPSVAVLSFDSVGVSVPEGVLSFGVSVPAGVSSFGVSVPAGVSSFGVSVPAGVSSFGVSVPEGVSVPVPG